MLAKAEAWEYTPLRVSDKERLAEETKQRRLAEAQLIVERIENHETPQYLDFDRSQFQEVVVETRAELLGENHPETLKSSWILGAMDFAKGRRDEGIERMRTAATSYEQLVPPTDELLVAMYDNLFQAELHTGQFEAAESWLDKLIRSFDAALAEPEGVIPPDFISGFGVLHTRFIAPVIRLQYSNLYYPGSYQSQQEALSKIDSDLRTVKMSGLRNAALEGITIGMWKRSPRRSSRPDCDHSLAAKVVSLIPNDQRSQRPYALAMYRAEQYKAALTAITLAAKFRAGMPDDPATLMDESAPHPFDAAILAMAHFQLARGLPESDPARAEHLVEANKALAQCQSIMADSLALNGAGQPWAEDRIAQSLLAEAEGLIGESEE